MRYCINDCSRPRAQYQLVVNRRACLAQVEETPGEHGRRGTGQRQRAPRTAPAQEESGRTAAERVGESAGQRRDRGRHQPGAGRVRRHTGGAEGQERGAEEVQTKSNGNVTMFMTLKPLKNTREYICIKYIKLCSEHFKTIKYKTKNTLI